MRFAVSARSFSAAAAALPLLLLAPAASLAAAYTDVSTANVDFTGINDASGLWEQPAAGAGDTLVFSPSAYVAECPGPGCPSGSTVVDDNLEFTVEANPGGSLNILLFEESGTAVVDATGGFGGGGVDSLITVVTITHLDGTAVDSIIASGPSLAFVPGNTFDTTGTTNFTGSATLDLDAIIAAALPGDTRSATSVTISLNNPLNAFEFSTGGTPSGRISKDEFKITVVPEPGTALLLGLGLAALAGRGRRA